MSDNSITGRLSSLGHPRFQEIPKARSGAMSNYLLQSQAAERVMASIMARLIETGVYEVHGDEVVLCADYRGTDIDYTPLELRAFSHMACDQSPCSIDRVSDAWYEGFDLGTAEGGEIRDWSHPSGMSRDGKSASDVWPGTDSAIYSQDRNGDDYLELTRAFQEGFEAGIEDVLQSCQHSPGGTPNGPIGGDHYWNSSATIRTSRERRRAAPVEEAPASEPLDIYTAATRALSGGW